MAKLVSKVYGDALFEAALEDNRLSSLSDEVTAVKEIIAANDDLSKLMDHPQIDKEEKVRIIEEIFGGRVSAELVGKYLLSRPFVMATKGKIDEQNDIVKAWFDYVNSDEGQAVIKKVGLILPQ